MVRSIPRCDVWKKVDGFERNILRPEEAGALQELRGNITKRFSAKANHKGHSACFIRLFDIPRVSGPEVSEAYG
ncbi:MAG TPA: hypothetical protein VGD41_12065, partial [Pyrinomonadaceae bacterium]